MATLHGCRWEWCRNVFNTHSALVDHIKAEHLLSMRPVTKRNAAAMLRAEGYTPEEVASRLIPGYEPTQPLVPPNDPPHQAPQSSPLVQQQPQVTLVSDTTSQEQPSIEQAIGASSIQSPPATPPPVKNPERTIDDDGDILMPSSSPPPNSPTPSPSPERPAAKETLDDDGPEHDTLNSPIEYLVPVSSPPPAASARASSIGPRTPRLKRRSSFSQMSSSPPADEFTAPRYEPLPASPSTAKMIEEREKELKEKETERGVHRRLIGGGESNRAQTAASRDRATTPVAEEPLPLVPETPRPVTWRGRSGSRRGLMRGRGRGRSGLHLSTPGRQAPPAPATRRVSPGLRIESRPNPGELQPPKTPPKGHSARSQTPPKNATQSTVDKTPTAEQMISQYTHADSYDDEDILDDLKAGLDDPDLGLQTQAPYISQTQTQASSSSQIQQ